MSHVFRSCLVVLLLMLSGAARSAYPDRPVHLIVPFPGGGASDAVARIVASALSERLGQPVVVENRAGADGAIGMQSAASAAPDGYTVLYAISATAALPVVGKASFDMLRDFVPVSTVGIFDYGMFVSSGVPNASPGEFAAYAKAHPDAVNFATLNVGEQLAASLFQKAAGARMLRVPYKSMAQIVPDMTAHEVHVYFGPLVQAGALSRSGARLVATLGTERAAAAPDVPTMREAGFPDVVYESVQMLWLPAKTPRDIVERLSREVNAVVADARVREKLAPLGLRAQGSTPGSLRDAQAAADAVWARFALENRLRPE